MVAKIQLGELVTFVTKQIKPESIQSGTTYIGLESIGRFGVTNETVVVSRGDLKSAKLAYDCRHVLYGKLRPNLGKTSRPKSAGVCSTDILPILPGEMLDRNYLAHFLLWPKTIAQAASQTTGANLPRISADKLRKFEIPLPELSEQRRLAGILDDANSLRSKRLKAITLVDELEESIFEDCFGESSESEITYEQVFLTDFCRPRQWPVISTKDLKESGYTVYGANGPIGFYDSFTHANPTIAITCRGASSGTINITPPETYINGNAMALDNLNTEIVTLDFLVAALRRRGLFDVISGSAQPQITKEGLGKIAISVPPQDDQLRFGEKVNQLNELRHRLITQIGLIDELIASLQDRAFNGEL